MVDLLGRKSVAARVSFKPLLMIVIQDGLILFKLPDSQITLLNNALPTMRVTDEKSHRVETSAFRTEVILVYWCPEYQSS